MGDLVLTVAVFLFVLTGYIRGERDRKEKNR